jgi:hypothetical protein
MRKSCSELGIKTPDTWTKLRLLSNMESGERREPVEPLSRRAGAKATHD